MPTNEPPTPVPVQQGSLSAIDLFAGCGGLTTGLKQAGFRVVAAVEINRGATAGYELNHSDVGALYSDIRTLSGERIMNDTGLRRGELDLLAGCPPCQGFSRLRTLNKGAAVKDERNDLVFEYLRLIEELLPRSLMFENVPGLLQDERFELLLEAISQRGYRSSYAVHDASEFGVPQRRQRLILLASREGAVAMPSPAPGGRPPTVRDTIGHLPAPSDSADEAHHVSEARQPEIRRLIAAVPHDGGSRHDLPEEFLLACHQRCDGFYDVYGRMKWDDVSPTITSGFVNPSKGRFLHPDQDRCVTPREAALLQTFPSEYVFPMFLGKYPVAMMIGNAFPPALARRHAEAVRWSLEGH